jgi:hypothetical protein
VHRNDVQVQRLLLRTLRIYQTRLDPSCRTASWNNSTAQAAASISTLEVLKTSERSSSIATAFHFINTFNIKHTRSFIVMTKTTKRRICRIDGCDKIVKSQGLCQRHGAKTRMCKMENCSKQAQGNFDGMCKVSLTLQ